MTTREKRRPTPSSAASRECCPGERATVVGTEGDGTDACDAETETACQG
ncbi:hypothetical protein [Streptomyces spectabilis]|nr:hypothetical protein [Streptomyces spectabilis]